MVDAKNTNNNNKKDSIDFSHYDTDVAGVSMKKLETGLWWIKNKKGLKNILIVFLLLIALASWGYTLYGFGYYLLTGMNADEKMLRFLVQSRTVDQNYLNQIVAKNLTLSPAGFIADQGKYDLYAQVTNPNAKWWASFDYCFKRLDDEQSCGSEFVLPGEKKYVLSLSQTFSDNPSDLNFSLTNIVWNKIDNHAITDWTQYQKDRLDIAVKNQSFIPAANNAVSEKVGLNTLTFNLINNSAFNYWEVPLIIILTSGNRIVYVNTYTVSDFISYENRDIQITWPGEVGNVTNISITPDLNILDQEVYRQQK